MDFDIQDFLRDMRAEQQAAHERLVSKVDRALSIVHNHETRIVVIEKTHKTARWLGGAVVISGLGAFIDLVVSHLPKFWSVKP